MGQSRDFCQEMLVKAHTFKVVLFQAPQIAKALHISSF
jgi:hypothetical protein